MNIPFHITADMRRKIEVAGYQNIEECGFKVPLGTWPADRRLKEIGAWCAYSFLTGLEGWSLQVLTKYLGVSELDSCSTVCFLIICIHSGAWTKFMSFCKSSCESVGRMQY